MESTIHSKLDTDIELRYFQLKGHVCVQLSSKMTGADYQARTGILQGVDTSESKKKGRAMFLCLDKSGSMSGRPFTALKQGAAMVAKSISESNDYSQFNTLMFDTGIKTLVCNNEAQLDKYLQDVEKFKADGSTNFVEVFKSIEKYVKGTEGVRDISVIFFTDGQDTCNNKNVIMNSLEDLTKALKKKGVSCRFLTIGFTNDHDAMFLN